MPDGDVISSSIQHRWRSAYAGVKGGASAHEVAPRLLRALTDTLRSNGGIAGQTDYGSVVEARVAGELTSTEARAKARLIARSQEQTPFALIVRRAVDRCLVGPVSASAALAPGVLTVAEVVCTALMDAELFERIRPVLVGERFLDHAAFDRFVAECHAVLAPGVARIAESLSRDPSASRLRANPTRRRSRRPTTATILNTSIL